MEKEGPGESLTCVLMGDFQHKIKTTSTKMKITNRNPNFKSSRCITIPTSLLVEKILLEGSVIVKVCK